MNYVQLPFLLFQAKIKSGKNTNVHFLLLIRDKSGIVYDFGNTLNQEQLELIALDPEKAVEDLKPVVAANPKVDKHGNFLALPTDATKYGIHAEKIQKRINKTDLRELVDSNFLSMELAYEIMASNLLATHHVTSVTIEELQHFKQQELNKALRESSVKVMEQLGIKKLELPASEAVVTVASKGKK